MLAKAVILNVTAYDGRAASYTDGLYACSTANPKAHLTTRAVHNGKFPIVNCKLITNHRLLTRKNTSKMYVCDHNAT